MFLRTLEEWTTENRRDLEARGVEVLLSERSKPSQWLNLRTADRELEVGVWASGECEVAVGHPEGACSPQQSHHDFTAPSELVELLDNLSARVFGDA
jgi:hypothetical protein